VGPDRRRVSVMAAGTARISVHDVTTVLAARHQQASGPRQRVSGFVVQSDDRGVRVTCRYYDVPAGVRLGRVLAQVFGEYAKTLAAAGYPTEPWRRGRGGSRQQVGLIITGRS
jgi:hypothetical protein